MVAARIISLGIGYICGLFLAGYVLGKFKHVDITKEGSGNVGTTNATRILGAKVGLVTLFCDIFKGLFAALLVWLIYRGTYDLVSVRLLMSYATFGAMLGHMFPVYMGFKGGKGVATSLGFMAVCVPQVLPLCILTFLAAVLLTKYVSLGSVLGVLVVVAELFLLGKGDVLNYEGAQLREVYVLVCAAAALVLVKHHENIGRLLRGEENKLNLHGKKL